MHDLQPAATRSGPVRRASRGALATWIVLCAVGEGVGVSAASAAAVASRSWVLDPLAASGRALVLVLVVAGGLVEGMALGTAQAAGLRRWFPDLRGRRWITVTVAVAGIGWALASLPSVLTSDEGGTERPGWLFVLGAASLGAGMGLVLGAAQALVLRGTVSHPRRWVGANAFAWSVAMVVIFLGSSTPGPSWSPLAVIGVGAATGLAAGAVLGLLTGCFLPSLTGSSLPGRLVLRLLRSRAHGLLDHSVVALRVRGVVTGSFYDLPVMYAEDAQGLVVFPGHAAKKRWWRNLRHAAPVSVLQDGCWRPGRGELLAPGSPDYQQALDSYHRRWPRVTVDPNSPLVRIRLLHADPR